MSRAEFGGQSPHQLANATIKPHESWRNRRCRAVGVLALSALMAGPALAAPPPVGSEDWNIMSPFADWIQSIHADNGTWCCDVSDGRPVEARMHNGRWQVHFHPGSEFAGEPPGDGWHDVPPAAVIRLPNPVGVPIAWWLGGVVRCFVPGAAD